MTEKLLTGYRLNDLLLFQVRDTATPVPRSGNPGYQVGKNLLYGTLNETTTAEGVTTYPFKAFQLKSQSLICCVLLGAYDYVYA